MENGLNCWLWSKLKKTSDRLFFLPVCDATKKTEKRKQETEREGRMYTEISRCIESCGSERNQRQQLALLLLVWVGDRTTAIGGGGRLRNWWWLELVGFKLKTIPMPYIMLILEDLKVISWIIDVLQRNVKIWFLEDWMHVEIGFRIGLLSL